MSHFVEDAARRRKGAAPGVHVEKRGGGNGVKLEAGFHETGVDGEPVEGLGGGGAGREDEGEGVDVGTAHKGEEGEAVAEGPAEGVGPEEGVGEGGGGGEEEGAGVGEEVGDLEKHLEEFGLVFAGPESVGVDLPYVVHGD